MRKFTIPEWEYSISKLGNLSSRKKYVERFRLEYYLFLGFDNSFSATLKKYIFNWLGYFNLVRLIIKNQLFAKTTNIVQYKYIILIDKNPSFIKTVLPLIDNLILKQTDFILLYPVSHKDILFQKLDTKFHKYLLPFENIGVHISGIQKILHLLKAVFASFIDTVWFGFSGLKKSFSASSAFGRYSFLHYYFSGKLEFIFKDKKNVIVGAVDYWLWESLIFISLKETMCKTVVLQHGKLTDLYYPLFAKQFYCWGEVDHKEMVEKFKAKPKELVKAGSPYFDNFYNQNKNSVHPGKEKYITFFAQPYGENTALASEKYKLVLSWLNKLQDEKKCKIAIKLHPHDKPQFYQKHTPNIKILDVDLTAALHKTSILLTIDSTAALEASVMGIPSVQCLPIGHNVYQDLYSTGLTILCETYDELSQTVDKLLKNEAFYRQAIYGSQQALNQYFYNLGNSMQSITQHLEEK